MRMIASFNKAEDAHLLRARLEGSGIAAYVRDENMISIDLLYSNAIGGVKVDVADEDFAAASALLQSERDIPTPTAVPSKAPHRLNLAALFLLVAFGTFVMMAVRSGVIAKPSEYAEPMAIGVVVGLGAIGFSLLRRRATNAAGPTSR